MAIKAGYSIEDSDVWKIIGTALHSHITLKLAYMNGEISSFDLPENIFVDSIYNASGDNNTINTTDTTAEFDSELKAYVKSNMYDDFEDGIIDTNKWNVYSHVYDGADYSVLEETSGQLHIYANIDCASYESGVSTQSVTSLETSNRWKFKIAYLSVDFSTSDNYGYAQAAIYYGSTRILYRKRYKSGTEYYYEGDLTQTGEYEFIREGTTLYVYKNGSLMKTVTVTDSDAAIKFECIDSNSESSGDGAEIKIDYVKKAYSTTDEYVVTNSIFSGDNYSSIFVYAHTSIPSGTSITFDVSQDGGNTWTSTNNNLGSVVVLTPQAGMDIRLRFKLSTTDNTQTPVLYGIAAQVWT